MLLKVVLCAYAGGIVSSRAIARPCEDHVTFIALCGARTPHVTTIAAFVGTLGPAIAHDAAQLRTWLPTHPHDRRSAKGAVHLSNRTDPDSAKMATGKGVVQGYSVVAAVDANAQIFMDAQAHGTGTEQEVLLPVIAALSPMCTATTRITADAGYHSDANLRAIAAQGRPALIADNGMRRRDEHFATQGRHQQGPDPLHDKTRPPTALPHYQPHDFAYDPVARTCVCPAGKSLYRKGKDLVVKGYRGAQFRGAKRDCVPCAHRTRCLRTPARTETRQVMCFDGPAPKVPESYTRQTQRRQDAPEGRASYGRRLATVEPVFANLRHDKGLARFTLRGRAKVDGQ